MSESNTDFEFGEEFSLDFDLIDKVGNKRAAAPPQNVAPKRQKIFPVPKKVVKRKFPGPAGILPDRKDNRSELCETSYEKDPEEIPCSQMSAAAFHSSSWLDMTRDYESLIEQYNIKWIKVNATLNKLENRRAPFLAAMIHSIECFEGKNVIVKVVLKDVSGEIHGTIMQSLYEEYSTSLIAGSVIVLRQCGVLTTNNGNHYLTIIPKNLARIYWKSDNQNSVIKVQDVSCQDLELKEKVPDEGIIVRENVSICGGFQQSQEDLKMVQDALEGVDVNSFFGEF